MTCRICKAELRVFEQPEGYCNRCLIAHSVRPVFLNPEPRQLANPDLERLDFDLKPKEAR